MTFQLKAWKKHITRRYCTRCQESSPSFRHATETSLLKSLCTWQKEFASALRVCQQVAYKQAFCSETGLYCNHRVATQTNWQSECSIHAMEGISHSSDMEFPATWPTKFLLAHLSLVAKKWPVFLLCVHPTFPCDLWCQAAFLPHLNPQINNTYYRSLEQAASSKVINSHFYFKVQFCYVEVWLCMCQGEHNVALITGTRTVTTEAWLILQACKPRAQYSLP